MYNYSLVLLGLFALPGDEEAVEVALAIAQAEAAVKKLERPPEIVEERSGEKPKVVPPVQNDPWRDYIMCRAMAMRQGTPLLIWVGHKDDPVEKAFPNFVHCHVQSFQGITRGVVLGLPDKRDVWRVGDLPAWKVNEKSVEALVRDGSRRLGVANTWSSNAAPAASQMSFGRPGMANPWVSFDPTPPGRNGVSVGASPLSSRSSRSC